MNRSTTLVVGAAAVAMVLLLLTAAGAVQGWLGVALTACLLPVVGLAAWFWQPPAPPPRVEYVPTPAPPPPALQIQGAALPSADPDYRFLLSCVACWRVRSGGTVPVNVEELAGRTIVARASQLTATEQPGGHDLIRHMLDAALAAPMPDRTGNIEIWAHNVSLTLPNDDLQRQRDLAGIRKDEQVWEHRRNYERNVRTYLSREVLPDTGSAVVWRLAQDPKQIRETAELIDTLARLSAAANNRAYEPSQLPTDGVLGGNGSASHQFGPGSGDLDGTARNGHNADPIRIVHDLANVIFSSDDEAGRTRFADLLARLSANHGKEDLAARIRADFYAPDLDVPDLGSHGAEENAVRHVSPPHPEPSADAGGGPHYMPDDPLREPVPEWPTQSGG